VTLDHIELVAATMGPGLVGPLLVGLTFAKGVAYAHGIPFVPVNHVEGHVAANILQHPELQPHHLTLVVSGGHTMLVEVKRFGEDRLLGHTVDEAAGEAFDKVAKLMGLGYPGGARLDRLARQGDPDYVTFPRAVIKERDYRFSYSGLKTAVALYLKKIDRREYRQHKADIAASFQEAAVEVLVQKTVRAAQETVVRHVTISGGVAANSRLQGLMAERLSTIGCRVFVPPAELCTDNAAMIAAAGFLRFKLERKTDLEANAVPYLTLAYS
jgi:N6-L-threonylcarbamoyladenine synthase